MKLLGERNWYLPAWLEWLPPFEPEMPSAEHCTPWVGTVGRRAGLRIAAVGRILGT
jgi:hypothetical protein